MAGTAVLTTLGYAGIESVRVGDYVYAKDEETGEQKYMPVLETYTNEVTEICTLNINGESIETTVGHKFYTIENGWMSAGDLSKGDTVELSDGSSGTVDSVEITELDEPVTVYNFCVMDFHTYYIGESEVLVHNRQCGSKADVSGSSGNSVVNKSGRETELFLPDEYYQKLDDNIAKAIAARDAEVARIQGLIKTPQSNIATVVAGVDIRTGEVYVGVKIVEPTKVMLHVQRILFSED